MKKALLFLFTVLALFAFISCDNSVDYPFDDDVPAVETPEMVPLTFEFIKDGKIIITNKPANMKFTRNSGAKQDVPANGVIIAEGGDRIKLFATRTSAEGENYLNIKCTSTDICYVYGNVMSLIKEEGFAEKKDVFANAFRELFKGNEKINLHDSKKLVLPATTLAMCCYNSMFEGCTSLTSAPELKATTLANRCYQSMFKGCTSLTSAPELKATILVEKCYEYMFYGCSSLNYIKCLATNPNSTFTNAWVEGVAEDGIFEKDDSVTVDDWTVGISGIPKTWYCDPKYIPLTLEFITAGRISILNRPDSLYFARNEDEKQLATDTIYVKAGEKIHFYADRTSRDDLLIRSYADCYIYGNVMSLIKENDFANADSVFEYAFNSLFEINSRIKNHSYKKLVLPATTLAKHCYRRMFVGCTSLTTAPELPATSLTDYCYEGMFIDCTSLTTAPELPAISLAECCYWAMFLNCRSLTTAPELPATTLAKNCYYFMFRDCKSLINAPELPATTMEWDCYGNMFHGCTSLTTAPALPATTLAHYCYGGMFKDCSSLKTAPALPVTTLADRCYQEMFSGCSSLTTAPALPATSLDEYCYYLMFNSCTNLLVAPELPATNLCESCYKRMFYYCENLSSVTCLATNIPAASCTEDWLKGVSSSGTFTKDSSMNDWSTGESGIPSGWTVINQ